MAATKKTATTADAKQAAALYREALVDDSMDQLIGDLAVKMAEWTQARERRAAEIRRLEVAERAAEEAVVSAFEAARDAGAKVKALEKINLKPSEAIAAVNKRAKAAGSTASRQAKNEDAPSTEAQVAAQPASEPQASAAVAVG
ncbi:hypothetical protein GS966_27685 [Rhodococcus hoagii]|nr:hypothetical protein [Prescottella equi]NKS10231.1 hypothetical protein [Prescottella equi]NKS35222.1 hypothetical protein [Prescottella equi]NKS62068.1 hypothetical protein [Prescottella equi]NKS68260.1 hypothetical protein [Prescottella equi]